MKNFVPKFLLQLGLLILISATAQAAELFPEDAYSGYQADIKNGETLYNAGACGSCHGAADNHDLLGGGLKMSSYVGTFYVPNLSNSTKGIANWTNAAFLNAMLNGVSPKGRHYYPVFPYTSYAGMKPEDVLDIKAFIKTLSKSDNKVDAHEISFPYNVNAAMSYWKRSNFSTPRWSPGKDDQLARGKYLVENVGACGSCHTPRSTTFGLETDKALKGGKGLTGGYAPAIDASVMAALPSPDAFIKGVLVEGKKLNGQPIVDPVMRKIVKQTAKLSKSDRLAIFAYLKGSEVKIQKQKLTVQTCSANVTAATNTGNANTDALSASADDFIGKYCRNCHGLGQSAQGSFPAGSLSAIAADASFITPGSPSTSRLYKSILSGRMPIGGTKPSQGEIQGLADWITALGSKQASAIPAPVASLPPRMRKIIKRDVMVRAALADVSGQSELDRPFIRYFSYRSHYNGRFPCETEKQYSKRQSLYIAGLNKMLNSVSLGARLVVPETVANTKELLVRVDIRDLGWDQYQWDVLVNAYPYGVDPHSDPSLSALTKETHSVLPIMRSDWFLA
ncbi:MAG: c-type cytochrome, partial [Rhizobiaceae bacterium]